MNDHARGYLGENRFARADRGICAFAIGKMEHDLRFIDQVVSRGAPDWERCIVGAIATLRGYHRAVDPVVDSEGVGDPNFERLRRKVANNPQNNGKAFVGPDRPDLRGPVWSAEDRLMRCGGIQVAAEGAASELGEIASDGPNIGGARIAYLEAVIAILEEARNLPDLVAMYTPSS